VSNQKDPIDEVLRRLVAAPEPAEADRARADAALNRVIADAARSRRRTRRWVSVAAAVAVVVLVGAAVVAIQVARPTAAQATLAAIARVVQISDPLTIPDTEYAYGRTESVALSVASPDALPGRDTPLAYLLPQTRETWIGDQGAIHLRTTTDPPRFFNPRDEADYYAAGMDRVDGVGDTIDETVVGPSILEATDWPTDPEKLLETIETMFPPERGFTRDAEVIDIALDLIREPRTDPDLRAAVLQVIADLDLDLLETYPDGSATFSLTYRSPLLTRHSFTLTDNGYLVNETTTLLEPDSDLGVPADTETSRTTYTEPVLVSGPIGAGA
jgi:hypothetical protein